MPELPEVETTRVGIATHIVGQKIEQVVIRTHRLRLPVPIELTIELPGQIINTVERRAKYLLLRTHDGTILLHLGMSGSLRVLTESMNPSIHDHFDFIFCNGLRLRFNDPRRFGFVLWTRENPLEHPMLRNLGIEPLGDGFNGEYLYHRSRGRRLAVKSFIMNQQIVVGVGNIYAAESLFLAGIHPARPAGFLDQSNYTRLATAIQEILIEAIAQGGTTLRNFHDATGRPGYFQFALRVYGRAGDPCFQCGYPVCVERMGQRSTFYCMHCQA
ncbi:DNA-formamidopyrimidine glycosylase [Gammaproteobacteria bacterium]